jgi:hypothetical protein
MKKAIDNPKTDNPTPGNYYHISWAFKACVWMLVEICADDNRKGVVMTPKTKKKSIIWLSDLRLLNETAHKYKPF